METVRGFTLIEMVMVIMIASILSAFAMAKSGLFSGWQETGAAQSVASHLFAAQRLAIANRSTVYVLVGSTTLRACYDAACSTPAYSIDGSLLSLSAPSGSFAATVSSFSFDSQGRPSTAAANLIVYNGVTVRVEPETGLIW